MIRKIIHIEKEKCNGCGLCAKACHEGAIDIIDGKAKLVREHFCDGLGDCLPNCPAGAISFEEREAPAYNEAAVKARKKMNGILQNRKPASGGCAGAAVQTLEKSEPPAENAARSYAVREPVSRLAQWPCQIKLLPDEAPFFAGADILIAADCTAYAYANMHEAFMKGRITLIGCPKLDAVDYSEKLTVILANNTVKSILLVRMEVPCCGGLSHAVETALTNSGKSIPFQTVTLSREGRILR